MFPFSVSDDLYLTFLESMESHSSFKEVFDIITEFAQHCNNILEVMRDSHDEQVRSAANKAWILGSKILLKR